jgi:hypothetical protein
MTVEEAKMVNDFFRKAYPFQKQGRSSFCVNAVEAARRAYKFSIAQWLCKAYLRLHSGVIPHNKEKFCLLINAGFVRRPK